MGYRPSESVQAIDPFGMGQATAQPANAADVEATRARLSRFGLQDSMMGRANDWRGDLVQSRDALRESMRNSVMGSNGDSAVKSAASGAAKSGMLASL